SAWLHDFDWRKHEAHINSYPQFTTTVTDDDGKDYRIHFAALFSRNKDAIPLMCLHGWPGSFLEFLPIMSLLKEKYSPDTLPYHIIVPSLPGYAFSSPPPLDRDFHLQDVARLFDQLMISLSFNEGYAVQGGELRDVGSKVARVIAATYDNCKAVHINFCIMPEPADPVGQSDELEKKGLERAEQFKKLESAYALLHATKPATIGYVLAANPLSLLAWIGEKFLAWTDQDLPLDVVLESLFTPGVIGAHENPEWYIKKPMGYSYFPMELAPIPKSWVATTGDLVFHRQHQSGGHFAAIERPEVLLKDVEDFLAQCWHH
ncbi:MAG: hypothetical protein Q9218_005375, partial [Villophora microphyllina]